ncbi:bifunctional diguanylate cyclase/phosphodiesterase [Mesobacillus subterraneus]|uniref:EAL domain-containing protein n=1 Tax=Mesobacillus subterraneus TaxID=285983 RepID=A0A3R9EFX4_9BACI|nr:EAL domain-containing protein [Mesobacillus subterraneus]RSD29456.1 EAL domain-containing protein [Mesobacillus subterraneus]
MFTMPDSENLIILPVEYSIPIVILSIIISCLAAFTALTMNERLKKNGFFSRNFWLVLASFAMGLGIWAMHFIGMSAVLIPVSMEYNVSLTVLSVLPAITASYLAFYIANRSNQSRWPQILAGIIMGCGIAAMHYIGMEAMDLEEGIHFTYKPFIFVLSILLAIIVSYVALFIFSSKQKWLENFFVKSITSLMMGIAVASMHYTGMEAVVFYADAALQGSFYHGHQMDLHLLVVAISLGIFVILGLSGFSSLLDRYVEFRLNHFDSLTGLPNRRQFEKMIHAQGVTGLAIIHLHGLEKWNSRYGYDFGDEMIKASSEIIARLKPGFATLYRIEGNRFAIITSVSRNDEKFKISLERISAVLEKPLIINEKKLVLNSVCALAYNQGGNINLFSNAIAVLQHTNIAYNHEVIEYDPKIHTFAFERNLIQDIDRALEEDELFVLYQPIYSNRNIVFGVEALLRWKHPQHGMISPGVFIPILEENGKMHEVTDWLINHVCLQIVSWASMGYQPLKVAINVPGSYFTSPQFMQTLKKKVSIYGIDSRCLELEITETSVIDHIENAIQAVGEFNRYGFTVALDDFGTGVSSLSYLKRLPISTLKIDKSFVDDVPHSEKDSAIMKSIISLGHSLKLKVVVEGVESEEQVKFLSTSSENPIIQGYYYSRPLNAAEIVDWVNEFRKISSAVS